MRQTAPLGPADNIAGRESDAPVRWRLNTVVTWQYEAWRVGWMTRFIPHHGSTTEEAQIVSQGGRSVRAQLFQDLFVSYTPGGVRSPWEIRFDAKNLFREHVAFDITAPDYANAYAFGERPSYSLSIRRAFGRA